MGLLNIADFDPNYRESFNHNDIKGREVYIDGDDKIGTISDVLVDEDGLFRYFVIDLGFWIFGKKVLLPVGRSRTDQNSERIYAVGMTKQQAENLPEFSEHQTVDHDYEELVRGIYCPPTPLDIANLATLDELDSLYNPSSYNYEQEPLLYELNQQDHQTFKLYQERLIANKTRIKTGEVLIGKHIETETAQVSIPIQKERVVIERVALTASVEAVAPSSVSFSQGEIARIEIYEETVDIHKDTFVREEVTIKKVIDHQTVESQETLRREELDIDTQGHSLIEGLEKI
ncbi:DUF2382 domain-containing protein (plasmid) [Nostoc sp. UHCC 0302]|uniref:DUF2382 domain-containing protein n=1 Tax=Nostoc sp. UHCC 0302 TaxID=3134896 RepID=UPI00311C901A